MAKGKVPDMPDGNPPNHIVTFLVSSNTYDIDGQEYTIIVRPHYCRITKNFSGDIVYEGDSPDGPYAIDGAEFILKLIL